MEPLIWGWIAAIYFMANGLYGIGWPDKWAKSPFTSRRGLNTELGTPERNRMIALIVSACSLLVGLVLVVGLGPPTFRLLAESWHRQG